MGVLGFLQEFYPLTSVIIADGSTENFQTRNRASIAQATSGLEVDYQPYPYETPYFDRILNVLRNETDPYIIMGADDDFPQMEVFEKGEKFLRANEDYSTAMGMLLNLTLTSADTAFVRGSCVRQLSAPDPVRRALNYTRWMFPTTYAVTRREHLIERYERAQELFLAAFYDFSVGAHDATVGKIRAYPEIGTVSTRNFNHSYLRAEDGLLFLRRGKEVLKLVDIIARDLEINAGIAPPEAMKSATAMIRLKIAASCGQPFVARANAAEWPLFTNPTVQKQVELYAELFVEGSKPNLLYKSRFRFIVSALRETVVSDDNFGENFTYETLAEQMKPVPATGQAEQVDPQTFAMLTPPKKKDEGPISPETAFGKRSVDLKTLTYMDLQ